MGAKPKLAVIAAPGGVKCQQPSVATVRGWTEALAPRAELDVLVTPEIAQELLTHNRPGETNRRLSEHYIAAAIGALERNRWINTGEPIIVSDTRLLNDGQHRLEAIVRSGIPAIMDLRFGVPREAFSATNAGRSRQSADALTIAGAVNATHLGAALRLVLLYQRGGLPDSARDKVPNDEIVAAWQRWPEISEAVSRAMSLGSSRVRGSALSAVVFFALRTANPAAVDAFLDVLKTGAGDPSNPPHRLREHYMKGRVSGHDERTRALALGIIAWNNWNAGARSIPRLYWGRSQAFPVVVGLEL